MKHCLNSRGFTLLELLVSAMLLSVVFLSVFGAFGAGFRGYDSVAGRVKMVLSASKSLDRIEKDLKRSFAYSNNQARFEGSPEKMSFMTVDGTYARASYAWSEGVLSRKILFGPDAVKVDATPDEKKLGRFDRFILRYGRWDEEKGVLVYADEWKEPALLPAAVTVDITPAGFRDPPGKFEKTIYISGAAS